jgi:hypothetical protein
VYILQNCIIPGEYRLELALKCQAKDIYINWKMTKGCMFALHFSFSKFLQGAGGQNTFNYGGVQQNCE